MKTLYLFILSIMSLAGNEDTMKDVPQYLFKIVSTEQWQESLGQNRVVQGPIDEEFLHLATEDQVPKVAEKFWSGQQYIVLKLDPKKLEGRLIYEVNPGGSTKYYHLYEGNIPLEAVLEVNKVNR